MLDSLVDDVYGILDEGIESLTEEALDSFLADMKDVLKKQLLKENRQRDPNAIRLSNMGKPCTRNLWYQHRGVSGEPLKPWTRLKFLYGDIIEQLLIYLIRESGHEVTDEQKRVEVEGVKGSIDCKVDGVVCDIKSASTYSFKKFKDGTLHQSDPFGYIRQLSAYATAEGDSNPCFIALDKQHGHIAVLPIEVEENIERNIQYVKEEILDEFPPDAPYADVPDGKSGNMKLDTVCSYCEFKRECYPSYRTFLYSTGPRYLTVVARTPDVPEASA